MQTIYFFAIESNFGKGYSIVIAVKYSIFFALSAAGYDSIFECVDSFFIYEPKILIF